MKNNLGIIIQREFMERVAKKSFLVTTLLMPLLMIILMALPSLILIFNTPSKKTVAVYDKSGVVLPVLRSDSDDLVEFVTNPLPMDSIVNDEKYYGVLSIPEDIVAKPNTAILFLHESGSIETEKAISDKMEKAIRDSRMQAYNIPNLEEIMKSTDVNIDLTTVRVGESGDQSSSSSMLSFAIGLFMTFILYMFLLMYGQLVMTSIIEEKNNRVLELVVSSVKPMQLMLGKIFGVGLVAIVQILIWGVLISLMSAFVMPALLPESVASEVSMMNAGTLSAENATIDTDLLGAISMFSSVGFIVKLFAYMIIFLVGGFLFYASIFAAIGSSVDNVQDASQLTSFAVITIILGLIIGMAAGQDPNSQLAVWASIIPFTSPMVMLMRIPFDIPAWQIWTSIAVLYATFIGMIWISAKIYRVGIFMYGKKPNIKDLVRWAKYK